MLHDEKTLAPYDAWKYDWDYNQASHLLMGIGVGGILYPPNSLDQEVTNEKRFMQLAPYADDLWFKSMALKRGTKYMQASYGNRINGARSFLYRFITIEDEQSSKLGTINVLNKKNDTQIKAIFDHYKLWSSIGN